MLRFLLRIQNSHAIGISGVWKGKDLVECVLPERRQDELLDNVRMAHANFIIRDTNEMAFDLNVSNCALLHISFRTTYRTSGAAEANPLLDCLP